MPGPSLTREDDLAIRSSRRQSLLVGGGVLLAGGLGALGYFGAYLGAFDRPLVIAFGGGCTVLGLASVILGARLEVLENTALPEFESLPAEDPRRRHSLGERRRDWLIGLGIWVLGWVLVALALLGPLAETRGLLRLAVLLGLPWASVALGARWMTTRTGSTSWPSR